MLQLVFGARAQVAVGALFVVLTIFQTIYWLGITPATTQAVFIVSMEALAFAAYGIIATGLGYRATERVESIVVETVRQLTVAGDIGEVQVEVEDKED
jgi:hypothetical protein